MKTFFDLIRIKHWIKNMLIFIPIISARQLSTDNVLLCIIGFFSFSIMTSSVYIINDIKDIESDKVHFRKKFRPIASNKISIKSALLIAIILFVLSITLNTFVTVTLLSSSLLFLLIYLVTNLLYSFGCKNLAIIDVLLLAAGFIIRVYYGASIIDVEVSNYLFLTILSGSLFLGLGKRKKELSSAKNSRKVLKEYNEQFLDKFQYIMLTLVIVFYTLWVIEQDINYLFLTIPLLIIVFMKYCLIIETTNEGDPTTIIYGDKYLLLLCLIFALSMILILVVLK